MTTTERTPKYSVHFDDGPAMAYAQWYGTALTLEGARHRLRRLVEDGYASFEPWDREDERRNAYPVADVYPYDPHDDDAMCHGDYPLRRFAPGPIRPEPI